MTERRDFIKKTAAGALGLGCVDLDILSANEEEYTTEEMLEFLAYIDDRTENGYTALAFHEIDKGNFELAMKVTREGLKFFPDSLTILNEMALWNCRYKNLNDASILWRKVVEIMPNDIESLINLSIATGLNGNQTESDDALNKVLQIEPDKSKIYATLGLGYHKIGHNRGAIELLKEALKVKPVYPKAQMWLDKISKGEYLAFE